MKFLKLKDETQVFFDFESDYFFKSYLSVKVEIFTDTIVRAIRDGILVEVTEAEHNALVARYNSENAALTPQLNTEARSIANSEEIALNTKKVGHSVLIVDDFFTGAGTPSGSGVFVFSNLTNPIVVNSVDPTLLSQISAVGGQVSIEVLPTGNTFIRAEVQGNVIAHKTKGLMNIDAGVWKQYTSSGGGLSNIIDANNYALGTTDVPGFTWVSRNAYKFTVERNSLGSKVFGVGKLTAPYGFVLTDTVPSDTLNGEIKIYNKTAHPNWLAAAMRISENGVVSGGFGSIPYSYLGVTFNIAKTSVNVWILNNPVLNVSEDRIVTSGAVTGTLPTGEHIMRFKILGDVITIDSSIDDGVTWVSHFTRDVAISTRNTFDAGGRHEALTNIKTIGGNFGLVFGLSMTGSRETGEVQKIEINPL